LNSRAAFLGKVHVQPSRNSLIRVALGLLLGMGVMAVLAAIALAVLGGPILFRHATPPGAQSPVQEEVQRHMR
jgi:hypothetical protein